jgi:hypothetical protein
MAPTDPPGMIRTHVDLGHLAADINKFITVAEQHARAAAELYRLVGERLLEAKRALAHGDFGAWLKANCRRCSERQARRYMLLAKVDPSMDLKEQWRLICGREDSGRRKPTREKSRRFYGDPLNFRGLRHEPINESGVVFLFGMVARELDFIVESVQEPYPDCEAKREVKRGKWERVRIEFEVESRDFVYHKHPLDGCDLIVCWEHNWSECPLEVLELKSKIKELPPVLEP